MQHTDLLHYQQFRSCRGLVQTFLLLEVWHTRNICLNVLTLQLKDRFVNLILIQKQVVYLNHYFCQL